jgi:hypothetical protein
MASRDPNDLCPELREIYFQWLKDIKVFGK